MLLPPHDDQLQEEPRRCVGPLGQAAPARPLPDNVIDLDDFRVRRRDLAGGVIHEYRQVA